MSKLNGIDTSGEYRINRLEDRQDAISESLADLKVSNAQIQSNLRHLTDAVAKLDQSNAQVLEVVSSYKTFKKAVWVALTAVLGFFGVELGKWFVR